VKLARVPPLSVSLIAVFSSAASNVPVATMAFG
jgi:hypothetical protein